MSILDSAELLLQARNYSGSGNWLDEANSHDAVFVGPLFKAYDVTVGQYIFLPGTTGNYLSTPNAANNAHDNLTDLWIAGRFALDDWTPAADTTLIAKWEDTSNERSYRFMVDTTGVLRIGWSTNGASGNVVEEDSTTAPTVSNGALLWVAATVDISVGTVKFYTGGSGTTPVWVQLGTTVSGSGASSIHDGTAVLEVGTDNTGTAQHLLGEVYDAEVKNGYDEGVGTLQFDLSSTAPTTPYATFAELSTNATTVTINRTSTGLVSTVVDRNMFLLTTNDRFEIPDDAQLDFTGSEALTVMSVFRPFNVSASSRVIAGKKSSNTGGAGYNLFQSGANAFFYIDDGTDINDGVAAGFVAQVLDSIAGVRNITDDDIEVFSTGSGSGGPTTDTTTGSLANALAFKIGSNGAGTPAQFYEGEIHAVALWRSALTDTEVLAAHVAMATGYMGEGMLLMDVS